MDTLSIIQSVETSAKPGDDLMEKKYSIDEVDVIVKEARRLQELETLKSVIVNLSKRND